MDYESEANDVTTRYYHSGGNAVVEYVDDDGGGLDLARHYVHGNQYVDERAVLHDDIEDDEYYYTLSDLFTVDGLINNTGHEVERYTYDAYGKAVVTVVVPADVSFDGTVSPFDVGIIKANYGPVTGSVPPYCDLSGNGYIDPFDVGFVKANYGSALSTSPRSSVGNP